MNWLRVLGGLAVFWIAINIGVVTASLFTSNELFRGSGYGRAVAAVLAIFLVCFLVVVAVGSPDRSWKRTSYW